MILLAAISINGLFKAKIIDTATDADGNLDTHRCSKRKLNREEKNIKTHKLYSIFCVSKEKL